MIIFTLTFIKNPYVHLLKNWPLLTQVSLETYQKRAFTETRFLLGFSVYGASGAGHPRWSANYWTAVAPYARESVIFVPRVRRTK